MTYYIASQPASKPLAWSRGTALLHGNLVHMPRTSSASLATYLDSTARFASGFDCVANEPFGFDTIRMKENNLRHGLPGYLQHGHPSPPNDWRLVIINDSANGGANHLFGRRPQRRAHQVFQRLCRRASANALVCRQRRAMSAWAPSTPALDDLHVG